jgi:uncharacterized protein YjbI with pentapeptide repeats
MALPAKIKVHTLGCSIDSIVRASTSAAVFGDAPESLAQGQHWKPDALCSGADMGTVIEIRDAFGELLRRYEVPAGAAGLRGAVLEGAELTAAQLAGADLAGSDLHWARLFRVNLEGATLRRADLRGARLDGARLEGARYDAHTRFPPASVPTPPGWSGR